MIMGAILNAQEREEWEFRELFEAADPRFKFKVCHYISLSCPCAVANTLLGSPES